MLVQKVPLSQIFPHPNNPRIPLSQKDSVFLQIQKSYKVFGRLLPYIVNQRNNYCLSGNQRMAVDIAEGVTEAYVVFVDLDERAEKELMIALNRITGFWDNQKLSAILEEFTNVPNFDFESIGFTMPEVSQILDRYGEQKDGDDFDFNATLESIKEPVTKKGDLIQLGMHRILCGDSSNPTDMKTLMGDEKADILDCDFPYNVNYGGGSKPNPNTRPKKSRKWPQIYSDDMPQAEYEEWMRKVLSLIKQYLKPGAAIYVWQGLRQLPPMYQMLLDLDFHISCFICWLKESAAITYADYCYRTEQCLYGYLKGAAHYWAGKAGESNVWEVKRDPTKSYVHPTQKPIQLGQRALQNSSKIGDIVLDTFLGSGSILMAAESLGRRCLGMELDPKYVDVIVLRYINFAGPEKVSKEIREKYLREV